MANFQQIASRLPVYIAYYFKAGTRYDIHSPFLSEFIMQVFEKKGFFDEFQQLSTAHSMLTQNREIIPNHTASFSQNQHGINIADFTLKAASGLSDLKNLYRLCLYKNPSHILELGTAVGLSSLAMGLACKKSIVETVEINPFLCRIASSLHQKFKIENIQIHNDTMANFLKESSSKKYDLIFLDAHHDGTATIEYVEKLFTMLQEDGIIIMDDIHWSASMYQAWNQIINSPLCTGSLETMKWGYLFKSHKMKQLHKVYIPFGYKWWRNGFW